MVLSKGGIHGRDLSFTWFLCESGYYLRYNVLMVKYGFLNFATSIDYSIYHLFITIVDLNLNSEDCNLS